MIFFLVNKSAPLRRPKDQMVIWLCGYGIAKINNAIRA
jgi:hypothetical protein